MGFENNTSFESKVSADVNIAPRRSQIFVSIAILGVILLALIGCLLIYVEKDLWWVPFVAGGLLALPAFWSFKISHTNAEMYNPIASELSVTDEGIRLVTDPRLAGHSTFFSSMVDVFSALRYQKPLPPADALLDELGNIIPDSGDAAADATARANELAEQMVAESMAAFHNKKSAEISSSGMATMPHQITDMKNVGDIN